MVKMAKIFHYGSRLLRRKRGFKWFCAVVLQTLGISRWLTIDRGMYRVRFATKSNLAATIWVDPSARLKEEHFMRRYLKSGDVVIDVGANIGLISLSAAALVGSSGRILSIEPHPQTFEYLKENVALNQFNQIELFNLAITKAPGKVNFTSYRSDDTNKVTNNGGIIVEGARLDDVISLHSLSHIELLKIDVEGFERDVLLGATNTLAKTACIFIEVLEHRLKEFGSNQDEIVGILRNAGFHLWYIEHDEYNMIGFKKALLPHEWLELQLSPIKTTS